MRLSFLLGVFLLFCLMGCSNPSNTDLSQLDGVGASSTLCDGRLCL